LLDLVAVDPAQRLLGGLFTGCEVALLRGLEIVLAQRLRDKPPSLAQLRLAIVQLRNRVLMLFEQRPRRRQFTLDLGSRGGLRPRFEQARATLERPFTRLLSAQQFLVGRLQFPPRVLVALDAFADLAKLVF